MKRIGIFGGSFNPPHLGHVQAAQYAISALDLDLLLVIPSCNTPQKPWPAGSGSDDQRLHMLKAMFSRPKMEVSTLELDRGGTSYTADTVTALSEQYPEARLTLLLGSDSFLKFHNWYLTEVILDKTDLAVFYRGGKEERQKLLEQSETLKAMGARITLLDNPITQISSTDLRRLLVFGCAQSYLGREVEDYICSQGLYGTDRSYKNLSLEELEREATALLKPSRVAHVLGCRQASVELAERWGADPVDAARAALLHDVTKALDGPLQLTLCRQYGIILDKFSAENPKTLHALTGSLVAERIFGENKAVVDAIRSHTTGKADMNTLQKIIYVADYMEPNRDFPGVEQLRTLAYTDLDGAMILGLEMTLEHLHRQGSEVSSASADALQWLRAHR